jgi:hypothetical protein
VKADTQWTIDDVASLVANESQRLVRHMDGWLLSTTRVMSWFRPGMTAEEILVQIEGERDDDEG